MHLGKRAQNRRVKKAINAIKKVYGSEIVYLCIMGDVPTEIFFEKHGIIVI